MLKEIFNYSKILLLGLAAISVQSCNDDDDPAGKGEVTFEITDAPTDDANVKGVFVTVADIKVNGESIGMTQKQTIDLTAYADGQTKLLGTAQLDAKSYNSITLVLDNETDANGNAPGNYVLTTDDSKFSLNSASSGQTEITLDKSINVTANTTESYVLDFDLRKSIQRSTNTAVKYQFVDEGDLKAAIRVLEKDMTGKIEGTYQENFSTNADMIIVFAYKKGEFDQSSETTANANGMFFTNAKTSAVVKEGLTDSYKLSFVEEGEYELAFAAYTMNSTTNQFELNTLLDADLKVGGNIVNTINVDGGVTTTLSAIIIGLL